jgi:class 3 adenylate cyclase
MILEIHKLERYASRLMIEHLLKNPEKPTKPVSSSFYTSMLFADMKSFTVLTERLTEHNPASGIRKLASYLDIYIGKLVEIISQYGGDIIKFAGDAAFAIWKTDKENLPFEAHRAVKCGLSIQKQLNNYKVDDDVILALRVGVGAGLLHELHLGGLYDRWELLFAGDPMAQVGQAGKIANPGEVIVSPQAAKLIQGVNGGEPSGNGYFRLKNIEETAESRTLEKPLMVMEARDALRAYIPRAILVSLDEGYEVQAELLLITVIFVKVSGFQFTSSTPVENVQKIMSLMQRCLYRYEGSINRFGVDEKGAILLAAFGLPPLIHEDDAVRGIKAAHDIREELEQIGHSATIGIATGMAFCGPIGSEARCEYTMHGVNVNLAARMMVAAETILCDSNTYEAAKELFKFEQKPPLTVKGRSDPVVTFKLV